MGVGEEEEGFHLKHTLHIAEIYSSTKVNHQPHALMSLNNANCLLLLFVCLFFLKDHSGDNKGWSKE